jgi:hypothetical protein
MAKVPNPSLDKEPAEGSREVIDRELQRQDEKGQGKGGEGQRQSGLQQDQNGKPSSGR